MSLCLMMSEVEIGASLFAGWSTPEIAPGRLGREARSSRRVIVETPIEPEARAEEDAERWDGLS